MKIHTNWLFQIEIYFQTCKKFFRRNNYFIINLDFKKPKKNKILIYNTKSKRFSDILFKNKNCHYYNSGYQNVNLYILFFTLKKSGFKNLKKNYISNYFNFVKPDLVYTSMDNYIEFYQLKEIYSKATYISDQNAMRDNKFIQMCKKFKNKKKNLHADLFFCFGDNRKKELQSEFKSKIYSLGNTINNFYKIKKTKKEIKKIIYISSGKYLEKELTPDIKIFSKLKRFSKEKKLKLIFMDKPGRNRENFFKKIFGNDLNYLRPKNILDSYNVIRNDTLFVFTISTLGYEILSKGVKCISLEHNQFKHSLNSYKNKGPFWIDAPKFNYDYDLIKKLLNKIINLNNAKWDKIYKKFSKQILKYDSNNITKKNILKKYLS